MLDDAEYETTLKQLALKHVLFNFKCKLFKRNFVLTWPFLIYQIIVHNRVYIWNNLKNTLATYMYTHELNIWSVIVTHKIYTNLYMYNI